MTVTLARRAQGAAANDVAHWTTRSADSFQVTETLDPAARSGIRTSHAERDTLQDLGPLAEVRR
jgi:hypothetical protein